MSLRHRNIDGRFANLVMMNSFQQLCEQLLSCITYLLQEVAGLVDVSVTLVLQLLDYLTLLLSFLAVATDLVFQGFLVLLQELDKVLLFLS